MSISFVCPGCGRTIRAPKSAGGRIGECRHCNQSVTIPLSSDESSTSQNHDSVESTPKHSESGMHASAELIVFKQVAAKERRRSAAFEKATMMHNCGLNREAQLALIDIVFSPDSDDDEKAESLYFLGNIAFEESRVAASLKMWRQLVDQFPESTEASLVKDRLIELAEVVGATVREQLDNVIAASYLSHADFWSRGKETCFVIDSSWIDKFEAALKWYDRIIREFPQSVAAKIAYEEKLRTIFGWQEPGEYGQRYGIVQNLKKFAPVLLTTFAEFAAEFPDASTLQAFRFQIAQMYWSVKDWDNTRTWLHEILSTAGSNDGFYTDLAKRRLKKLEY